MVHKPYFWRGDEASGSARRFQTSAVRTSLCSLTNHLKGDALMVELGRSHPSSQPRSLESLALPNPRASGICEPVPTTESIGMPLSLPVMTAPFGNDVRFRPLGQIAVARCE